MTNPTQPSGKPTPPASLSLAALASGRLVPVGAALPKANSETYGSLLEAIVRSTDDAIITKNLSSIITSWNPAATAIFGWEAHEMIGHSLLRLIPSRLHHEELDITRRLRMGEHIEHFETIRETREGREINVALTISPLRNSRGEVIGAIKIARNITEQRAAEQARLQLAAIVESSSDAILAQNTDGIIVSWNAAAERMFGYRADEIIGMPVQTLIPEDLHEEANLVLARLLGGQGVDPFETFRLHRDGRRLPVSISASSIVDQTGEVTGESQIMRDISRQKLLASSLMQAERLAANMQLAAELAHHVNNPLEALTNLIFLAREQVNDPDRVRTLLELADAELARAAQFTRRTLDENCKSAADAKSNFDALHETLQYSAKP